MKGYYYYYIGKGPYRLNFLSQYKIYVQTKILDCFTIMNLSQHKNQRYTNALIIRKCISDS